MWPATRKTHQRRSIDFRAVVIMSFFIPNSHSLQMLYGVIEPRVFDVKNWETIFCPFKKTAFRISYFCPLLVFLKKMLESRVCVTNWTGADMKESGNLRVRSLTMDVSGAAKPSAHHHTGKCIYIVTILFCESCVLCIVIRPKDCHLCTHFSWTLKQYWHQKGRLVKFCKGTYNLITCAKFTDFCFFCVYCCNVLLLSIL